MSDQVAQGTIIAVFTFVRVKLVSMGRLCVCIRQFRVTRSVFLVDKALNPHITVVDGPLKFSITCYRGTLSDAVSHLVFVQRDVASRVA